MQLHSFGYSLPSPKPHTLINHNNAFINQTISPQSHPKTTTTTNTNHYLLGFSIKSNPTPRFHPFILSTINNSPSHLKITKSRNITIKIQHISKLYQSNPITKQAFIDVSIDGQPIGRITIGLYSETVPAGSSRFKNLVSGAAGVSYRRKEFVKIMPNYIQHGGVRSYGVDAELAKKTGGDLAAESLVGEWEKQERCEGVKNVAKSVSVIVRDPLKPAPKIKLVAKGGKLEIDEEEVGKDPNGTEFVIVMKDSPELDSSALVVGRVIDGMDVVEKIGLVKTVKKILLLLISGLQS